MQCVNIPIKINKYKLHKELLSKINYKIYKSICNNKFNYEFNLIVTVTIEGTRKRNYTEIYLLGKVNIISIHNIECNCIYYDYLDDYCQYSDKNNECFNYFTEQLKYKAINSIYNWINNINEYINDIDLYYLYNLLDNNNNKELEENRCLCNYKIIYNRDILFYNIFKLHLPIDINSKSFHHNIIFYNINGEKIIL